MAVLDDFRFGDLRAVKVGRFFKKRVNTSCYIFSFHHYMIDTGPPNQWRLVRDLMDTQRPKALLITHHHEDHSGNAPLLQARYACRVQCHAKAINPIRNGFKVPFYRRLVWGKPHSGARPYSFDETNLVDEPIEVIETPGHSEDQVCLFFPQRGWLFSGDLYISERPKVTRSIEDPILEIQSLEKVLSFDFETLFCSHRGLIHQGRRAIQNKKAYLENLQGEARSLRQKGYEIGAIVRTLLGPEDRFMYWFSWGDFSKRNLIEGLLNEGE